MKVILRTISWKEIEYDLQRGGIEPQVIPCLCCGTCCTKWQPPIDEGEIATIARALNMPVLEFYQKYIQEYPLKPGTYLLRRQGDACVFLKYQEEKAVRTIYPFRPAACRNWTPSLSRRECQEGLKRQLKTVY